MCSKSWIALVLAATFCFVLPIAVSARGQPTDISTIKGPFAPQIMYLAIHHTEVRASTNGRQLESVNNFHHSRFNNISFLGKWGGYNMLIDVDGTVTWFRVYGEKTAAQLAYNFTVFSICLAGNFDIDIPKPAQMRALIRLLYSYPDLIITFHRDFADRKCPGDNFTKKLLVQALKTYSPKDAPPLKIHMGVPNLKAQDYVLIAREHQQDREKYLELTNDDSVIGRFEREKLRKIVERLDGRKPKYRIREIRLQKVNTHKKPQRKVGSRRHKVHK